MRIFLVVVLLGHAALAAASPPKASGVVRVPIVKEDGLDLRQVGQVDVSKAMLANLETAAKSEYKRRHPDMLIDHAKVVGVRRGKKNNHLVFEGEVDHYAGDSRHCGAFHLVDAQIRDGQLVAGSVSVGREVPDDFAPKQ